MTEPHLDPASVDIEVHGLIKTFTARGETVDALRDVSFTVQRGEFLAVVGPSGCGKTTLLRILAGVESASAGSVRVDEERARDGLAYVAQSDMLLPWRTALQNAALGLEVKTGMSTARRQHVEDLIQQYGLAGFERNLPAELSGGMRQRVAVIRALASSPKILLCDEPFSAVDFVTRLELNNRLRYMCRVEGITTVLVTHNIEEAIFLGDQIAVMSGRPGRIIATYRMNLAADFWDAARFRQAPEFSKTFMSIWENLKGVAP